MFAAYRGGGYAAVTRTRATTGPDPVGHLRAFLDGSSVELRWTAPTTPSIASVLVRIAVGATPPSTPSSGTLVAQRGPGTTSVRLPGLRKGTRYSVSVWTRDAAGRWSTPAHTGFTTLSGTRRDAGVAGVVTDTAGHPLSGVVVFAISYDTFTAYMRDRTDADGRYHFAAPAGRYLLALDAASAQGGIADSFGYVGSAHIVRLESGRTHRQDFALRAGGIVQGVVRDSDGNALAGVTPILQGVTPYVDVDDSSLIVFSEELGIDGRTGPTGRFVLRGVPPGGYLTCYDTSSGRVSGGGSDATGYVAQCGQATIVARARSVAAAPDMTLAGASGGAIAGTVLDPAGHPAPFRSVTVARAGARYPSLYGATGADGTFEIAGLAPGSYRVCSDESFSTIDDAPGSAPGCRAGVAVVSGRTVTTTVHLHPGAALSGTITDPSGTPIEGVNVTVDSRHSYGGFAVTDAHGHYLVTGLAPTAYRVCFYTGSAVDPTHPGGVLPGCYHHKADVRVVSGSVRTGIDAALGLAGGIAGVVTDSRGDPVPGAEIDAFSTTRHGFGYGGTGRDGRYTLHGLAAGDYYLCVDVYTLGGSGQVSCRHKPVHVVSRRVTRGIGFTFTAGGSVTVTVRDDDRHPMVGVNEVLLRACTRHDYCDRQPVFDPKQPVVTAGSWISDATGSVTFRNVLPGTYAVCALTYHAATATDTSPTGYADTCSGHTFTVQVRARHTTRFAQILHPGGVLTATVTDARGRPLRGAVVHVTGSPADDVTLGYLGDPGSPIVQNTSAADGTVTIRGIRPGRARICVAASGAVGGTSLGGYRNRCLADPATVSAADTTALGPLALVAGGAITGRLLDTAGSPVRDSLAVVFSRHGHVVVGDGRPNRAGEYRIDRLAAKTYVVCFLAYHYRSQCYDQVPWTGGAPPGHTGTPVVVTKGAVTSGIDARFVHR